MITILPTFELMQEIYDQPLGPGRFGAYLKILQGSSKTDLEVPISGFNPMAQPHVLAKMNELRALGIDDICASLVKKWNKEMDIELAIGINVADDLMGGWTQKFATDFDSKFKINALIERKFCAPYFYTSEKYTKDQIQSTIETYFFRSLFRLRNSRIKVLEDYYQQELFVCESTLETDHKGSMSVEEIKHLKDFLTNNQDSDDYPLIFNFFYGDEASNSLGYSTYGIAEKNGFHYARWKAQGQKAI